MAHAKIIAKPLYLNILNHRTCNKVHSGCNPFQNPQRLTGHYWDSSRPHPGSFCLWTLSSAIHVQSTGGVSRIVSKNNKMGAMGNKVDFSLIHPDLTIFISLLKFGIIAEKHHPGALNCDNHSRGIFSRNNLKKAVSVIYNMSRYIKGQNKSFLHQNHGTELASPRAASNVRNVRKWGHSDITILFLSSVHIKLFWLIK